MEISHRPRGLSPEYRHRKKEEEKRAKGQDREREEAHSFPLSELQSVPFIFWVKQPQADRGAQVRYTHGGGRGSGRTWLLTVAAPKCMLPTHETLSEAAAAAGNLTYLRLDRR